MHVELYQSLPVTLQMENRSSYFFIQKKMSTFLPGAPRYETPAESGAPQESPRGLNLVKI